MKAFYIDDITWNDLNMDDVLSGLDHSSSSVGKEYTGKALRNLSFSEDELRRRDERAEYFSAEEKEKETLKKCLSKLGRIKKFSFYDYIFRLEEISDKSNAFNYILIILLLFSVTLIFMRPAAGIVALVIMLCVNISLYFKQRSDIEGYFLCLKYLVSMTGCAQLVLKKAKLSGECFDEIRKDLKESTHSLSDLRRGSWLLTNSVSGSLIDVVMDYIRMIFHVDIIRFYQMRRKALGRRQDIERLYNAIGELELAVNISEYRKELKYYCTPSFRKKISVDAQDIFHPLIKEPVENSISTEKSVLFTGSNASGKSTFLKTLAVGQILAQSIATCPARSYKTCFFKVLSSMALSDDILGGESYFVVEIRSLKRIFDEMGPVPVLCFIDEVLRGTNTKERIAASSQILKKLSGENALVFAATHDIELTELLKDEMTNLHFSETIKDNEVVFDYKLKEGPADSKNAIRLLKLYGFDREIVENALKMCLP